MNENEIAVTWATLEPSPQQRQRMEVRLRQWLEARESSLAAEWLRLLKVQPLSGLGFAAVAASLMLIATPLSWLAFALV